MKTTIKTLLFLLTVFTLSQCWMDEEPNMGTIPDDNFLNALIELGVDTNGDGKISPSEAEVITSLNVYAKGISDMTGIAAFVNLDSLICSFNFITSLDVSKNTALSYLNCTTNLLRSLDISKNTTLTELYCGVNRLTNLDISNNTALEYLHCSANFITSLDVSNNTALEYLHCSENQLTSLDDSNYINIEYLYCYDNQLTTLDVSTNTALYHLDCSSNKLTTLDVSNNTALGTGPRIWIGQRQGLFISKMPTLYQVCVWTMRFPPAGVSVDTTDSPNVYFTTDCNK